jgi:hypothetical protein
MVNRQPQRKTIVAWQIFPGTSPEEGQRLRLRFLKRDVPVSLASSYRDQIVVLEESPRYQLCDERETEVAG